MFSLDNEYREVEFALESLQLLNTCLGEVEQLSHGLESGQDPVSVETQLAVITSLLPPTVTYGLEADEPSTTTTKERLSSITKKVVQAIKEFLVRLYKWITGTSHSIRLRRTQLQNGWNSLSEQYQDLKSKQRNLPTKREYFQSNIISKGLSINGRLKVDYASEALITMQTFLMDIANEARDQIQHNKDIVSGLRERTSDRKVFEQLTPAPRPHLCTGRLDRRLEERFNLSEGVEAYQSKEMAGGHVLVNFQLRRGLRLRELSRAGNSDLPAVPWHHNRHGTILTKLVEKDSESIKGSVGIAILSDIEIKNTLELTRVALLQIRNNESGIDQVSNELEALSRVVDRLDNSSELTGDTVSALRDYLTNSTLTYSRLYLAIASYMLSLTHNTMSWIRQSLEIYRRTE